MVPTLVSLPAELLFEIAGHLNAPPSGSDENPLPSLIGVSPRLRDVFSPTLYGSIKTSSCRRLALLLRTVLENPSVSDQIRAVDVMNLDIKRGKDEGIFHVRKAIKSMDLALLAPAAWTTFLTEDLAKQCIQDCHLGNRDAIFGLLIAHLHNLETLAFGLHTSHSYSYPMILFEEVVAADERPFSSKIFSQLRSVRVHAPRSTAVSSNSQLLPLLKLPSLRRFFGSNFGQFNVLNAGNSPILGLVFETCGSGEFPMERSLETGEGLKSLIFRPRDTTAEWRTSFWNSLCLRAKDSLEILCISLGDWEGQPWASLAGFTKLKHLHFPFHSFQQSNNDAVLVETLPKSLQSLRITASKRDAGHLVQQIKCLVEHAPIKSPALSSITLRAYIAVCEEAQCLVAPCLEAGISFHSRPPILGAQCDCLERAFP